jgi:hypothetical protein
MATSTPGPFAIPTPSDDSAGKKAPNSGGLGSAGAAVDSVFRRANGLSFADVRRLADSGDAEAINLLKKFFKGGARGGTRSAADAATLFEREVPAFYRSSPSAVADFMKDKDISHIQARGPLLNEGVSRRVVDGASNVKVESHLANQARGARNMTNLEQMKTDLVNNTAAVRSAAAVGAVFAAGLAAATHGQSVIDGRESVEEAGKKVISSAAGGAASGATFAVVSVLCPPVGFAMGVAAVAAVARAVAPSATAAAKFVAPDLVEQGEAFAGGVAKRAGDIA